LGGVLLVCVVDGLLLFGGFGLLGVHNVLGLFLPAEGVAIEQLVDGGLTSDFLALF
jgi:hypothetical protein